MPGRQRSTVANRDTGTDQLFYRPPLFFALKWRCAIIAFKRRTAVNKQPPRPLGERDIDVDRDLHANKIPRVPIADLAGKGIYDSVSSNRSKMNDQAS